MAKTERGQIATGVLSFTGDTTWLLSPAARKLGAKQWFYGGPGISTVGDNDIEDAEVGVFVDGHDFGDTQGTGKVELGDSPIYASANKVLQTVTAWSDWRITITIALGAQSPGVKYFFVTDGNGAVSEPKTCWVHRTTAIKLQASTNITAGAVDATTNRLTAPTGTFLAGDRTDDTNPTPTLSMGAGQFTEEEMSFVVAPGAINGQSYVFRLVERLDDGTLIPLDNYAVSPQITLGSAPVSGSATFHLSIINRTVGAKIGLGSARPIMPIVNRTTGVKVAQSSMRAAVPIVARPTGTKIAIGSVRTIEPIVALITGAAVSNVVQGSLRALLAIVMRATGTKLASGSALFEEPIVVRTTPTKVGLSSARVIVPVVERVTGTKVALGSGLFSAPIVERTSGTKVALGSADVQFDIIVRASGFKSLAQGSARFIVDNILSTTASKLATGSFRFVDPITASIFGSSSTAIQGSSRVLLPIVLRVTGTKLTTGSVRVPVNVIARSTGSKLTSGGALFEASNVLRANGIKVAGGSALFEDAIITRVSGTKLGRGGARAIVPETFNIVGKKFATGGSRILVTNWLQVLRIAGDLVVVHISIQVQDPERLLLGPDTGVRIIDTHPFVRIDHDQYRSAFTPELIEIDAV